MSSYNHLSEALTLRLGGAIPLLFLSGPLWHGWHSFTLSSEYAFSPDGTFRPISGNDQFLDVKNFLTTPPPPKELEITTLGSSFREPTTKILNT